MLFGLSVLVYARDRDVQRLCDVGWKGIEGVRTTIGVGARELAREGAGSPYMVSRNICELMTCASEGSEAAIVA